jgi:hypothetical protein
VLVPLAPPPMMTMSAEGLMALDSGMFSGHWPGGGRLDRMEGNPYK